MISFFRSEIQAGLLKKGGKSPLADLTELS